MPLYYISRPQPIGNPFPVPKLQILLEPTTTRRHIIRPRMHIAPIPHRLPQPINVETGNPLGIRQYFRHTLWNGDLVDAQIRVRGYNGTAREVDTLSGEVASETTLLAFETLAETANGFLAHLRGNARHFGVDVHAYGELEEFPLFLCGPKSAMLKQTG